MWSWKRRKKERLAAYDAGAQGGRNVSWTPVDGKAEDINAMSRDTIRKRARDLERNADHVEAIILALERNVVGNGIHLRVKLDDDPMENGLEKHIESLWDEWCRPENCDITGRQCLSEMETMAIRRMVIDGGIFFIKTYTGNPKFPLQLQIKEVDELYTGLLSHGKNKVVNGIEVNDYGKAVAYHFIDYDQYGPTGKYTRVKADRVIYLNQIKRPSQIREISGLSNVLSRLRDLNQYIDAVITKEEVLACFAAFIHKNGTQGMGRLDRSAKDPKTGNRIEKLAPGIIEYLQLGEEVSTVNPSGQASNAKEMVAMLARSVAAAVGLSYEAISRDMSDVNYSSARQNLLEDRQTYKQWQHYLCEHFCKVVYEWFLESCVLSGSLNIPDFFQKQYQYSKCTFIAKGMSWVDPVKEVNANRIALLTNQTTLERICAEGGLDYKDVLKQRAIEEKLIHQFGLGEEVKHVDSKAPRVEDAKPPANKPAGNSGKQQ